MDKATISKQIASLITVIKNQFEAFENKQQLGKEELEKFVGNVNELHKESILWEYLNSLPEPTKPVEDSKPEIPPIQEIPIVTPVEVLAKQETKIAENTAPKTSSIDIKKHIGFNDKFEFINELFKGSSNEYEAAIAQINGSASVQEATKIIDELKKKFNWQNDNETANRLLEIVKNSI